MFFFYALFSLLGGCMEVLDKVKKALRLKNSAFDDEISMLIESCYIDLLTSDAVINDITKKNELVQLAVINFVKSQFGLENKDASKYEKIYNSLKEKLKIVGDDIVF